MRRRINENCFIAFQSSSLCSALLWENIHKQQKKKKERDSYCQRRDTLPVYHVIINKEMPILMILRALLNSSWRRKESNMKMHWIILFETEPYSTPLNHHGNQFDCYYYFMQFSLFFIYIQSSNCKAPAAL